MWEIVVADLDKYLLVENAIALVDVCDIAIVFVGALSRELALLVDTGGRNKGNTRQRWRARRTLC